MGDQAVDSVRVVFDIDLGIALLLEGRFDPNFASLFDRALQKILSSVRFPAWKGELLEFYQSSEAAHEKRRIHSHGNTSSVAFSFGSVGCLTGSSPTVTCYRGNESFVFVRRFRGLINSSNSSFPGKRTLDKGLSSVKTEASLDQISLQ